MNSVIPRKHLRSSGPRQFPIQGVVAQTNKMTFSSQMVISWGDKDDKLHCREHGLNYELTCGWHRVCLVCTSPIIHSCMKVTLRHYRFISGFNCMGKSSHKFKQQNLCCVSCFLPLVWEIYFSLRDCIYIFGK